MSYEYDTNAAHASRQEALESRGGGCGDAKSKKREGGARE
jgi:hypothetical protein